LDLHTSGDSNEPKNFSFRIIKCKFKWIIHLLLFKSSELKLVTGDAIERADDKSSKSRESLDIVSLTSITESNNLILKSI
jgi:hypothetical protein